MKEFIVNLYGLIKCLVSMAFLFVVSLIVPAFMIAVLVILVRAIVG